MTIRLRGHGPIAPIALAAAATGVIIPNLQPLVEQAGHGPTAAGVFTAAHVLGGALGAAAGAAALRRAGSARTLAVAGLLASIAVTLAMAALDSLVIRTSLRFVDGTCHLLALTALVAAAASGDATLRARRAISSGIAIVLGIAAGLGVGAQLPSPELALVVAALLSGAALAGVVTQVAHEPVATTPAVPRAAVRAPRLAPVRRWLPSLADRGPFAPGLLAFGERFIFGTLSVAMPFLATRRRVGLVLGVFMIASVIALPLARRYALAWGARRLAVRSTLVFTLALGSAGFLDVRGPAAIAVAWAIACGAAAGALYASALVLAARSTLLEDRVRDMATVHAAGSAGHALGALAAGVLLGTLSGMLPIVVPGVGIIALATLGVWITVPEAARDCPVIGGLTADEPQPTRAIDA